MVFMDVLILRNNYSQGEAADATAVRLSKIADGDGLIMIWDDCPIPLEETADANVVRIPEGQFDFAG